MKMAKILSFVLALVMIATCFAACGGEQNAKTIEIKLWVSSSERVATYFEQQVAAFKEAHPEYNINVTIEPMSEGDAGGQVLKDVATAPDMYWFAQDQISRLVQGGALAPLGVQATDTVKAIYTKFVK